MTGARCEAPLGTGYLCQRPVRHDGDRCHLHPRFYVARGEDGVVVVQLRNEAILRIGALGVPCPLLYLPERDALELARQIDRACTRIFEEGAK